MIYRHTKPIYSYYGHCLCDHTVSLSQQLMLIVITIAMYRFVIDSWSGLRYLPRPCYYGIY